MAKDFTVTRPSPKWVLNKDSVLVQFADNFPSFEFNADGSYKGVLVEPASTNLILQSEDFSDTWTTQGVAVATNTTLAPDGETTGDTITGNGTNTNVHVQQTFTFTSAGAYTFSFFAKAGTHDIIRVNIANYVGSTSSVTGYNLTNNGTTTVPSNPITALGNGWYRIQFSFEVVAGDLSGQIRIFLSPSEGTTSWSNAGDSNDKSVILWGAQLEEGDKATSYIPTSGTTVTRAADYIYLDNASQYLPSSGTVVIKADFGESYDLNILGLTTTLSGEKEVKFTYSDTEIELFVNGVSIQSKTGTYDFSGMDIIEIGSFNNISHFNGHLQYFAIQ